MSLFGGKEDYPFEWDVATKPIYDEAGATIDGYHEIIRNDNQKTLHVATDRYYPISNQDFMNTVDTLVEHYDCKISSSGSFKDGREVFVQMENNEFVDTLIPGDKNGQVKGYVTLGNSHNGGLAFKFFAGLVRIWCENTWTVANKEATTTLSVKHTVNGSERVKQFADNIEQIAKMQSLNVERIKAKATDKTFNSPVEFAKNLYRLEQKPRPIMITDENGNRVKSWTAPIYSTRGANLMDNLCETYEKYPEIEDGNWRMFNAVTDIVDHNSSEKRINNGYTMFGGGNDLKLRAFNLLFN
tara:strand:- start:108 stop:1004 length:897 start_codon:yes stop_codon:yes gene_type:complete